MSVKRRECQQRWRCSRLGSLKYWLTHRLLPMLWRKDCIRSLIVTRTSRRSFHRPFRSLHACCKGAQHRRSTCSFSNKALFLLCCGDYAAVTGLAHKFRTQSGRQIISSYCSQLSIQLSRPTASLFRLL